MENEVPADDIRNLPLGTLADGRYAKIRVTSSGPDISVAILVREPGAADYHGIGARVYTADDYEMVRAILESAKPHSLWDASWQALWDGGSYTWGTVTQTGTTAVSLRFAFEVHTWTTRAVEEATDDGWMGGAFVPFVQALVNDAVAANPPTPLPPPVYNPYDPLAIGAIAQANILAYAQATRLTLVNGVVGRGPIP